MKIENKLKELVKSSLNTDVSTISALPVSGSSRKYYRINTDDKFVIGAFNDDLKENEAFFSFTNHFKNSGLNVPELLAIDNTGSFYLLEDLGDKTLFQILLNKLDDKTISIYKSSLKELIKFQVIAGKDIDYSKCYPRSSFDRQSLQWDLNYFKYYYLKFNTVGFDEQKLEDDFNKLINYLLSENSDYFMFRDFQSRNIMFKDDKPFFIDYQGGRKGPLQYDLASLLFQAKADLSHNLRKDLLEYYLFELNKVIDVDKIRFIKYYYGFVLIRMLQVLGAYGYRGLYERKSHFIESIDFAIRNVDWFIKEVKLEIEIPEIFKCLHELVKLNKNDQKKR